mmetsp:Transcript_116283/g.323916  ORF Transcript_116283/g.323916 Transcript_116283/m.323916 type:complete len:213 (+) Transcript_116283:167-805(+)
MLSHLVGKNHCAVGCTHSAFNWLVFGAFIHLEIPVCPPKEPPDGLVVLALLQRSGAIHDQSPWADQRASTSEQRVDQLRVLFELRGVALSIHPVAPSCKSLCTRVCAWRVDEHFVERPQPLQGQGHLLHSLHPGDRHRPSFSQELPGQEGCEHVLQQSAAHLVGLVADEPTSSGRSEGAVQLAGLEPHALQQNLAGLTVWARTASLGEEHAG